MLGLSSGPSSGPPPFSAAPPPPPPVDIALASLLFISLSNFTFSQFSLPALYLSESLIISMTDRAVWLRPASSSGFLSVPLPGRGPWLFSTPSHPPSPTPPPPTHPPVVAPSFIFLSTCLAPFRFSQAKRSRAACPSPSVPASALAWRRWCGAATSISTRCPKAYPGT